MVYLVILFQIQTMSSMCQMQLNVFLEESFPEIYVWWPDIEIIDEDDATLVVLQKRNKLISIFP